MPLEMITLDEAAARLGISPEEMKKRLKTDPEFKRLSQIRDGSTLRFKSAAIDELARQLGMPTEDGSGVGGGLADPGSDDFKVSGLDQPKPGKKTAPDDVLLDFSAGPDDQVFSLTEEPKKAPPAPPASSGKLTPAKPPKSSPNMSDSSAGGSDSDVRLGAAKAKRANPDEAAIPTEEIALDFSGGPGSAVIKGGSAAKLSAPKAGGSSGKLDASRAGKGGKADEPPPDSSEFELSLDADSDDFDLQMNPEGGDEVDLGSLPKDKAAPRGSASGINLSSPKDSGVSLEKGKGGKSGPADASKAKKADESDASDVDFELSLDSSAVASSTKLGAPKSGKLVLDSESDSEFELTLDDSQGSLEQAALGEAADSGDKGDIFETDFEIPAMPDESGSEAVAVESDTDLEKSDFELEMDTSDAPSDGSSESEVVLLDDEEEGKPKAKGKGKVAPLKGRKPAADDADVDLSDAATTDDEDTSASRALRGARGAKRAEDDEDEAVPAGAAGPAKPWGVLPALFLAPSLLFCLVGALMGYELLQTMWGYQQPRKPTAPIVRGIASQFDMELRDQ